MKELCTECTGYGKWEGRPMCRRQQSFDFVRRWLKDGDVCDNKGEHRFEQRKKGSRVINRNDNGIIEGD